MLILIKTKMLMTVTHCGSQEKQQTTTLTIILGTLQKVISSKRCNIWHKKISYKSLIFGIEMNWQEEIHG